MLKSMTGYGRAKTENENREISVEIKSVNHRYLDLNIKVPRLYAYLEDMVKKTLQQSLVRGKVDVYVGIKEKEGSDIRISPNMPVIEGYLNAAKAISEKFGLPMEGLGLVDVMKLPDAIAADKEEVDAEVISAQVAEVLNAAVGEYNAMRETEGARLCSDILYRGKLISEYVDFIEKRSPESVEEYREKIAVRMNEILDGSEIAQQKILSEAALFADKVSVTEELVRLRSHLKQLESMVNGKTAVGRKLDFLVQELNREANTTGSKANDYEIAKTVVELKAEIEKIREQIQNLE
ncbi:MAG: YicC family protein [Clostridia bacterium]|nr:YicC family protein [Clostridia bacterium]MBQ5813060.1 YicC family protein [Clostridia bacterium]